MYLTALCLLAAATVNQAGGTAVPFEDRFGTLEHWDLLDMRGDSHIAVAQDHTVPTGFGPTVLAIKGYHVIGLAKGLRLDTGTILVLYRECDPRGMDADGLLVCHASYDDSVSEEHNTKQVRSHVWLEQDNDAGLQFRSYGEDGVESLLAERPGYGLITEDGTKRTGSGRSCASREGGCAASSGPRTYPSRMAGLPETGVRAIYGMFQWGIENGMSGGFFYMKNDSKDHPGVFNNNLETHPEMDAAFIDVFADARLDGMPRHGGTLRLRLINKRPFTLRKVHLSGELNGTPIADQPLAEFPPHSVRDVPVQLPEEIGPEIIFVGALDFVTHYSFPCHVPLHGAVPTIIESNELTQ